MSTSSYGVGIIGASADRGWAKISHVPAVQQLTGFRLAAVASGSQAKADAAAQAFDAPKGYASGQDLIRDPAVDIVTIAVKVPDHRDLVLAAIAAGKHIYCEWPLGKNLAETEELAAAASKAGVHVALGLQTRANPTALQARALLRSGALGRVLSAHLLSTTMAFGPKVEAAMAFGEDSANGVTLLTIQGAHTLDFAIFLLGEYKFLNALTTTQFPDVEVGDPPAQQKRSTPDHVLLNARVAGGSALSVEVAGGRPADATPFECVITGEKGELVLSGGAARGFQSGRLQLSLNGKPQPVDQGELQAFSDEAANVAGVYALLRNDLQNNTRTAPDFAHAVRLSRLLDDVLASADQGQRKQAADWPQP